MIFRTADDGRYSVTDPEIGLEFQINGVHRDRFGDLVGEMAVACGILGARVIDGPLSAGVFNFSNPRHRDDWAKRLARLARTNGKLDWSAKLEEVCRQVIGAEHDTGAPAVILRNVTARPASPMLEALGLRFPREQASSLFGPGDGLKSYLALKLADEQARAGIRVGYFDWEMDQYEHRDRQARIDPEMPDIVYVRCERPLVHEVDRLRRIVRRERLDYVYLDSAAYATDGKPEDAVSVMAFFRAFRQLGIGGTIIAHSRREDGEYQPFGSVFWHNSFRATWHIKRGSTSPDGEVVTLGALPRKFNLGPCPSAVGLTVRFQGDRVYFDHTDVATIEEFAESLPLWQRIRAVVKTGPQTLVTIAGELNHDNVESLDRIVRKHKNVFTKVSGKDGITRIALVESRIA